MKYSKTMTLAMVLSAIWLIGCSEPVDDPSPKNLDVLGVKLHDIDNTGGAADLQISWRAPEGESHIDSYHFAIVEDELSENIELEGLADVSQDFVYEQSVEEGGSYLISLNSSHLTLDGKAIEADKSYRAFVYSNASDGVSHSLVKSQKFTLRNLLYVSTMDLSGVKATEGVSVGNDGSVYVSNIGITGTPGSFNGKELYKIVNGESSVLVNDLKVPLGHSQGADGRIYVTNYNGDFVSAIEANGKHDHYATDARFTGGDITFDSKGNLLMSLVKEKKVVRINVDGTIEELASGGELDSPLGIVVDNQDNPIVANFGSGKLVKIQDGEQVLLGTIPSQVGYLCRSGSTLYATGYSSHTIYKVSMSGNSSVLVGGGSKATTDGGDQEAAFDNPNGIDASPDGHYLYVSQSNGKLRKISMKR